MSPSATMTTNLQCGLTCCILLLTFLGICFAFAHKHRSDPPPEKTHLTSLSDIRALLVPPSSTPLAQLLQQRAAPNARLARAFGITNTFVTPDVDVHASFTRQARALVRLVEGNGWTRFAEHAVAAVEACLHEQLTLTGGPIAFDTVVQSVSLRVILTTLFEVPADEIHVADLAVVAQGINDLWRLSKLSSPPPAHLLADINTRLHRWIPDQPNPIDFIVPAFETTWRVVATTTAFVHADAAVQRTLASYLAAPSPARFEAFDAPHVPSVEALITESMRLHPPTRRISRQPSPRSSRWFDINNTTPRLLVADVGAVHRDQSIWGIDADMYLPMRHHPERRTHEQTQALLGFGAGRLRCVASGWAPRAAGVIVAAVCDALKDGVELAEGKEVGGREGWEGWRVVKS